MYTYFNLLDKNLEKLLLILIFLKEKKIEYSYFLVAYISKNIDVSTFSFYRYFNNLLFLTILLYNCIVIIIRTLHFLRISFVS